MADINRIGIALVATMLACVSQASWYWPFGSDDDNPEPPRLSELMEPASQLIDEASDCAVTGTVKMAVAKYREALEKLNQIEAENPDRAKLPEFATLRNKRAYVGAAIDSLLLQQVKGNAKSVAVSDTRELEKKLAEERKAKAEAESKAKAEPPKPLSRRERAMRAIASGDYATANQAIDEMLEEKPKSPTALNLKAVMLIGEGRLEEAERTLGLCIASNPLNYSAFYNMCELKLKAGNLTEARKYYKTGRACGGPDNPQLEALLK